MYEVHPESDPNRKRVLHRNLLLPCPFLPYEATPVPTKPSVVVKREHSTKKVKCEDRFALPMSEFKVPDDYEDAYLLAFTAGSSLSTVYGVRSK